MEVNFTKKEKVRAKINQPKGYHRQKMMGRHPPKQKLKLPLVKHDKLENCPNITEVRFNPRAK